MGGPIALIQNGDAIQIDAQKGRFMNVVGVSEEEWAKRKAAWKAPPLKATQVREREREREKERKRERGARRRGRRRRSRPRRCVCGCVRARSARCTST